MEQSNGREVTLALADRLFHFSLTKRRDDSGCTHTVQARLDGGSPGSPDGFSRIIMDSSKHRGPFCKDITTDLINNIVEGIDERYGSALRANTLNQSSVSFTLGNEQL